MDEIVSTTIYSSSRNRRATTFLLQFYCFALLQLTNVNASSTTRALFLWAMYNAFIFGCREKKNYSNRCNTRADCELRMCWSQKICSTTFLCTLRYAHSLLVFVLCVFFLLSCCCPSFILSLSLSPLHSQLSYTQPLLLAIYYKLFSV